ncbi:hypothetical protein [Microbacterium sp. LWH10-1.2]|uniref:hypothetical protein n=1 Tax=Microbacterium sp. LWH10-1.2 TaxID=3135255 RepID=UPI003139A59D
MTPRIPIAAAATLLLAATLTACSGGPDAGATPTPKATKPAAESTADPAATRAPETPVADPTCETIVTEGTVAGLTDAGWTSERKDFIIGDMALPDGILCFWADFSTGTDHGQLYGWSPISSEDADAAQSSLLAQGWTREDGPEGRYFTEDPEFSLGTDEEGYGMTYLFGDGWVKLADTKQSLILIDWAG